MEKQGVGLEQKLQTYPPRNISTSLSYNQLTYCITSKSKRLFQIYIYLIRLYSNYANLNKYVFIVYVLTVHQPIRLSRINVKTFKDNNLKIFSIVYTNEYIITHKRT